MDLYENVLQYFSKPGAILRASYEELRSGGFDLGFASRSEAGRDIHVITREISISAQSFNEGGLTNLLFTNGKPVLLEFQDSNIHEYYSDYVELRYVLWGYLHVEIEGELAEFMKDDICFIDSSARHRELISDSSCVLLNISVRRDIFDASMLRSISLNPLQKFLRANILKAGHELHYLRFSPSSEESVQHIQSCTWEIFREATECQLGYLDICKGHIMRLMGNLAQEYRHGLAEKDGDAYRQKLFESVVSYMDEHLSEVTMGELSREFHYQPSYFNRLIKRHSGITYSKLLIGMRVERAKKLLDSTNLSVEEIMWLVGYHNKTFFYRRFEEAVGTSPAAYRRDRQGRKPAHS